MQLEDTLKTRLTAAPAGATTVQNPRQAINVSNLVSNTADAAPDACTSIDATTAAGVILVENTASAP